ncbi:MAG: CobW/HypB/UreG, nucleotide-binding domain, partial [Clostridia bacterium]|nr:CobW/HypB/UreG, nucleotide-binding domain [Clostridia bacterium]
MKVDLVTGFLGAGKTTLVLNILQELQGKEKVA